jgi:hypothetical protein
MPGGSHERADRHVAGNHVAYSICIDVQGPNYSKAHAHHNTRGSVVVINPTRNRVAPCTQNWKRETLFSQKKKQTKESNITRVWHVTPAE